MRMRMRILSFSSKPLSSPGRSDKFPPPLMRFLRSDKSNRSRRTSRKTPLFSRKKKSIITSSNGIETTQEPSSPKVTCIGQVRVSRSKIKSSMKKNKSKTPSKPMKYSNYNLCCWSTKPHLCNWKKWKCSWSWKWFLFDSSSCCCCSSSSTDDNELVSNNKHRDEVVEQRRPQQENGNDENNVFVTGRRSSVSEMGTTPPRNALLLTRSRSSSLASRFWGEERNDDEEDDDNVFDYGRRSSASEMGTTATSGMTAATTPPRNALSLMRCRPSTLAYRFWGEEQEQEQYVKNSLRSDEDNAYELGRASSASEIGTAATMPPPKNALLLTRCRSSSLAYRFWDDENGENINGIRNIVGLENKRESTDDRGSHFSVECKSVGVCAEIEEQGGDFNPMVVKKEGKIVNENGKNEDGCELKLRRCKSEPARRDLEKFDPQSSEFWRLRRLSNVD